MIEDIEGGPSELTRRPHVVALSALTALVSLVLLVAPPAGLGTAPPAASRAPSATAGPVLTIASNPLSPLRVDLTGSSLCPDGTRLIPPYHMVFEAGTGRVSAVGIDGRTGRSVPVAFVRNSRTSPLTVTCFTSDNFLPWVELNTIAR